MKHLSSPVAYATLLAAAGLLLPVHAIQGQSSSSFDPLSNSIPTPRPFDPGTNTTNPSALASQTQNPYLGSVPISTPIDGILNLSLEDAVHRSLKANLGLIDSEQEHAQARAARLRSLSALLPQLYADIAGDYRNFPLITIGGEKLGLPHLTSAFNYQTAEITYRQNLLDVSAIHSLKASQADEESSRAALADSRNIVVLASTSAYLEVLASQSRVDAAQAELVSSQSLEKLLLNRVENEVSPEIDALRATVARQSAEQQLALARVRLEKDKLGLTRIIGLPLEQQFTLSTQLDFKAAPGLALSQLVDKAAASRQDLKAAGSRVESANQRLQSASAERLPSIHGRADVGENGINFGHDYGVYDVEARLSVPIFTGRQIESGIVSAQAVLQQRQAELADLRQRASYDVHSAFLDLEAAVTSVEVAKSNLQLASTGFREARDRFDAGVVNSLDVIQAQQELAAATENNIDSLYAHNLAKLMLIRSTEPLSKTLQPTWECINHVRIFNPEPAFSRLHGSLDYCYSFCRRSALEPLLRRGVHR